MSRQTDDALIEKLAAGSGAGNTNEKSNLPGGTLTTRQGHPVTNNQNKRTVGERGPRRWRTTSSSRRSPTSTASAFPSASCMRAAPARTATSRRTARSAMSRSRSTRAPSCSRRRASGRPSSCASRRVIHGGHSPETLRDPRGFAIKFYTEDGNWDLVGNNLQGLLHPRRDEVPGRGPRVQAGSGHQPPGRAAASSTSSA